LVDWLLVYWVLVMGKREPQNIEYRTAEFQWVGFASLNLDKLEKVKFRHACEGRHPELSENTGFTPSRE
jgi:hypothetical protein